MTTSEDVAAIGKGVVSRDGALGLIAVGTVGFLIVMFFLQGRENGEELRRIVENEEKQTLLMQELVNLHKQSTVDGTISRSTQ